MIYLKPQLSFENRKSAFELSFGPKFRIEFLIYHTDMEKRYCKKDYQNTTFAENRFLTSAAETMNLKLLVGIS